MIELNTDKFMEFYNTWLKVKDIFQVSNEETKHSTSWNILKAVPLENK